MTQLTEEELYQLLIWEYFLFVAKQSCNKEVKYWPRPRMRWLDDFIEDIRKMKKKEAKKWDKGGEMYWRPKSIPDCSTKREKED